MKISQMLISVGLTFGMIATTQATPTYTVKMANASPIQLQQAIQTNYVIIRKADGKHGSVDYEKILTKQYGPVDGTLKDLVNEGLAYAQATMPEAIHMSGMSGHMTQNFQGEIVVINAQSEPIYDCMTDPVYYPDPDNGHFVFTVTGPNTCTLTSD